MASSDYIELHARSAFSFHRGASSPEQLAARAAALGLSRLALCDRDGLYSAPRLYHAAREQGIGPIIGAEVTLENAQVLPLLAATQKGYRNLSRAITRAKLRSPKNQGRIRWTELEAASEGLLCLTGDEEGPLRRALEHEDRPAAQAAIEALIRIFGKHGVFVEIQRHQIRGEEYINRGLVALAKRYGLRILATNGVLYHDPLRRQLLDVFTCLRHHTHLDAGGLRLSKNAERHLKNGAAMTSLFADLPEAISNTRRVAERIEFTLEDLGYRFPDYPVGNGDSMEALLRRETYRGAKKRYGTVTVKIKSQLDHELELIHRLGFSGYFLIVWDLVRFAQANHILVQGRGSAANSAVCYCLEITAVDPIGCRLLFERFLSEGQKKWPDIDLDLPSGERREAVIQEVYRRYAPNGAAMTANVITYRGRSAMREMGKALNLPESVFNRYSELYGGSGAHPSEFMEQLQTAGLPNEHPRLPALCSLFQQVYGLPRHLGQHSGGMVICNHGLDSIVPLEKASMPGRVVLQWDKDDCEDLGIIKIDLLGLGMMAAMQDCVQLCRQRGPSRQFDLATIPKDDPATFDLLQKADTLGVFQVESRAQMATLPRMQPRCFYDVAIEVAIIRPGPIAGKLTHPYLDRRTGREPVRYMHPSLVPILERTLGVPLFQEQMLQIAMIMARFTGSQAEELRRALSFHRSQERLNKVAIKLRTALDQNKVPAKLQDEIIRSIRSFALYGFPESHAISFALIAYASAWLKVHRTVEFFVSLLNNQPMGFYTPASLIQDAKRHGIAVHPVSVLKSDRRCSVESNHALRLGLNLVHGLSRAMAEEIVQQRARAHWRDMRDFLHRTAIPKNERRVLAEIGALNGLARHRRDALWEVEKPVDPHDLFAAPPAKPDPRSPEIIRTSGTLPPMTPFERVEADYRGLALTTGPHPMAYLRPGLDGIARATDLPALQAGTWVKIAGLVICRQRPETARGVLFISLEDETGIANAFVPSKTFEEHRLRIVHEPFLIIEGVLQKNHHVTSVLARKFRRLPAAQIAGLHSHDFH